MFDFLKGLKNIGSPATARSIEAPQPFGWIRQNWFTIGLIALASGGMLLAVYADRNQAEADHARQVMEETSARLDLALTGATVAAENIARLYSVSDNVTPEALSAFVQAAGHSYSPDLIEQGWVAFDHTDSSPAIRLRVGPNGQSEPLVAESVARAPASALARAAALPGSAPRVIEGFALELTGQPAPPGVATVFMTVESTSGRPRGAGFATVDISAIVRSLALDPHARLEALRILRDGTELTLFDNKASVGKFTRFAEVAFGDVTVEMQIGWRPASMLEFVRFGGHAPVIAAMLIAVLLFALTARQLSLAQRAAIASAASSQRKSEFLAMMSHEIRTPLNAIVGMADLIRKGPLTAKQSNEAATLTRSAETLLTIINQVLDFSKQDAEKLDVERIETNLAEVVRDVAQAMTLQAAEKRLNLVVSMPLHVPRLVMSDPLRLRQILTNLVSNAIKFTAKGHIVIAVSLNRARGEPDGPMWITFKVRDTGVGMTPKEMQIVFEPYRQADSSTTRTFGGTGLGLTITRRLATLLGGDISVESQPGRGTTFSVELPFETLPATSLLRRELGVCAAQKILVAVEDAVTRDVLIETLDLSGALAIGVADISDARAALQGEEAQRDPFDIVLFQGVFRDEGSLTEALDAAQASGIRPKPIWVRPSWLLADERPAEACAVAAMLEPPLIAENVAVQIAGAVAHRNIVKAVAAGKAEPQTLATGLRILVVEDNAVNQMYVDQLLKSLGCESVVAGDGAEAVATLQRERGRFDLVLMDCQMPTMDGFAATRKIGELISAGAVPETPIVALTANALAGDRERCLQAGMCDYLSKPVREHELAAMIARWTSDRRPLGFDAEERSAINAPQAQATPAANVPAQASRHAPETAAPAPTRSAAEPESRPERLKAVATRTGQARRPASRNLDQEALQHARSKMGEQFGKMLETFVKESSRNIVAIPKQLRAGSLDECAAMAHTLQSTAALFGATRLAEAALDLELAARSSEATADSVASQFKVVVQEFNGFLAALEEAA